MGRKAKSPRVLKLRKKRMKKIKGTFREVTPTKKPKRITKKTSTKQRTPPTKAKKPQKSGWLKKRREQAKKWVSKHD